MSDPRIAFVVDHPQRDLAGVVLTAETLCRQGVTCHLVPLNLAERETFALAPDLVVLNFMRRGIEPFVRRLREARIAYVVLDTEGGVWGSPGDYVELLWEDAALRAGVRTACVWGPRLAAYLVDQGILRPEQVTVTGCPRFDFYHPSWAGVIAAAEERARPHRVLLNTNFSVGNPRFMSAERNNRQYLEDFHWPAERVERWYQMECQAVAGMTELAANLARDFPDAEIVLRPHPFEAPETYRDALDGIPNVRVDATGPVQPRIIEADVVIQRSCSTAVESGMAGVPTLSPRWIPRAEDIEAAEVVSDPCPDYAALRDRVGEVFAGTYAPPGACRTALDETVAEWFGGRDGAAHERVAAAVLAALPAHRMVDERCCRRAVYGLHDATGLAAAGSRLRHALGLGPQWSFRRLSIQPSLEWWESSPKRFTAGEVQALASRVGDVRRVRGEPARPVRAMSALERADFRTRHHIGPSLTLTV